MAPWAEIQSAIAGATGTPFAIESRTAVGGGCINQCFRVAGQARTFFIKLNAGERRAMFESLTAIHRAGADIIITYYAREAARALR